MKRLLPYFILVLASVPALSKANDRIIDSLHSATKGSHDSVRIRAFTEMAYSQLYSNPELGFKIVDEGMKIALPSKWKYGLGICYNFKTSAFLMMGQSDSAIYYADLTYALMKELKNKRGIFVATVNKSQALVNLGRNIEAVEAYQSVLREAEKNGDKVLAGQVYTNIAIVYYRTGDKKTALEFYHKSEQALTGSEDKRGLANAQANIGVIHMEANDMTTALNYFKRAEQAFTELNDIRALGMLYNNIGRIHYNERELDKALVYFEKAREYKESVNDQLSLIKTVSNIGIIHREKKNPRKALPYFEKAIDLATQLGSLEDLKVNYLNLSTSYDDLGDHKQAYKYHCLYADYKDSVMNAEKQATLEELKTKYQTEQKEQKIKLLKQEKLLSASEMTRQKNFRNSLGAGILLSLSLGGVVFNAYRQKRKANVILSEKNNIIELHRNELEVKNTEITDSINYAKRIQNALLPSKAFLMNHLPEHFILYKPKDIVSGDFYWTFVRENGSTKEIWIAVADCTGHGVPGAFMSMIGVSLLNEIMNDKKPADPAAALELLREAIIKALNQEGSEEEAKDGMDISLLKIEYKASQISYSFSGAYNPSLLVSDTNLVELPADKAPVGNHISHVSFTNSKGLLIKGDTIYLFSDGYADQFGGPDGKKFKFSRLRETLKNLAALDITHQKDRLEDTLNDWRSGMEQVDDICILGIRI